MGPYPAPSRRPRTLGRDAAQSGGTLPQRHRDRVRRQADPLCRYPDYAELVSAPKDRLRKSVRNIGIIDRRRRCARQLASRGQSRCAFSERPLDFGFMAQSMGDPFSKPRLRAGPPQRKFLHPRQMLGSQTRRLRMPPQSVSSTPRGYSDHLLGPISSDRRQRGPKHPSRSQAPRCPSARATSHRRWRFGTPLLSFPKVTMQHTALEFGLAGTAISMTAYKVRHRTQPCGECQP